jgi:hypothetical protein
MNILNYIKKIGVVCIACSFILGSVLVFSPVETVDASILLAKKGGGGSHKSGHKSSKKPSKKPNSAKKLAKANGAHKSNNKYAKASKSGHCKKVGGKCVTFSKGACGNFYIGGYHFGGKKACSVLGIRCGRKGGSGGAVTRVVSRSVSVTASSATSTASSTLTRSCTPGVTCPDEDLGEILEQTLVTPGFAAKNTKTCPLFWVTGRENADSKIKCSIDAGPNRTTVALPNNPITGGYENGFPLPIGKYTMVCVRTSKYLDKEIGIDAAGNEVVLSSKPKVDNETLERVVECKQNPAFREV